jgi:hypothetical protein
MSRPVTFCRWVGLERRISLHQGSALAMPFSKGAFDRAYMLHVGMNIADKTRWLPEKRDLKLVLCSFHSCSLPALTPFRLAPEIVRRDRDLSCSMFSPDAPASQNGHRGSRLICGIVRR